MDSRWIFLHRERSVRAMEGRRRVGQPWRWSTTGFAVGRGPGKSGPRYKAEGRAEPYFGRSGLTPMLPGKASKRVAYAPVPKPTQVGEWRTLRRSSELWLRNSANCPRNFGRRGALSGQVPRGPKLPGAAENRPRRLFTKNTGLC